MRNKQCPGLTHLMAFPVNKPEKEPKAQTPDQQTYCEPAREEPNFILVPEQVRALWSFSI